LTRGSKSSRRPDERWMRGSGPRKGRGDLNGGVRRVARGWRCCARHLNIARAVAWNAIISLIA
jgi:hypothetical protein